VTIRGTIANMNNTYRTA